MLQINAKPATSIYIVEDQDILRTGLVAALSRTKNLQIVGAAGDGLTAAHQVKDMRPDIVLMDISLPQMNGIAATADIRKSCPDVKVLILSAHEDDEHVFNAFSAGASGYCLKDVPGEKLQLAIQSVSSGAVWVDERVALKLVACVEDKKTRMLQARNEGAEKISLSAREKEIVGLIAEGLKNKEIAHALQISISTVRTHISNMAEKLAVSSRTQLVLKAQRAGLV